MPPSSPQKPGVVEGTASCLSVMPLNHGNSSRTSSSATPAASTESPTDSHMNWAMSEPRLAPTDLRTPTSRARCTERAVARFIN
jgi:hypothetical protein